MKIEIAKEDASVLVGAVTSIAGVVADLKFDNSFTSALTAVGVIVTALASYWKSRSAARSAKESEKAAHASADSVAKIAAKASTDNTSKTVLVQTVTAERATWRAEMREHTSALVMLLRASARSEDVAWTEVDRLRTGIRLRLNPAGRGPATKTPDKHALDRVVHMVLDELATAGSNGAALHGGIADTLELSMAPVLKGEWEVSKDEAVTGELKVS